MRPILIDTNAFSALKRADPAMFEIIQSAEVIGISPVVIGKLLFGYAIKQNKIAWNYRNS